MLAGTRCSLWSLPTQSILCDFMMNTCSVFTRCHSHNTIALSCWVSGLWSFVDNQVKVNLLRMFFMGPLVQCKLASWIYFIVFGSSVQLALAHEQLLCAVRNMKVFLRVRFDAFISLARSKIEILTSPSSSFRTENYSEHLPATHVYRNYLNHVNFPSVHFLMF